MAAHCNWTYCRLTSFEIVSASSMPVAVIADLEAETMYEQKLFPIAATTGIRIRMYLQKFLLGTLQNSTPKLNMKPNCHMSCPTCHFRCAKKIDLLS